MADAAVATQPKAEPKAAAQPTFCVLVTDVRLRIGNALVTKRAGTILHPVRDSLIIAAVNDAYHNTPPLPIRELTEREHELLAVRGRF